MNSLRKTLQITKVDFRNSYREVPVIPPSAKPVTGPHRVGDYVIMSHHGYIVARYRKEKQDDFSKYSSPILFRDLSVRD